ncbi:MAG: hypothetical protein P8105_08785, partial [Dehalococcoidia bacterium]
MPAIKIGKLKLIFEKQVLHYFLLAVLLTGVFIVSRIDGFMSGRFLNISTPVWFYSAIVIAVVHQVY